MHPLVQEELDARGGDCRFDHCGTLPAFTVSTSTLIAPPRTLTLTMGLIMTVTPNPGRRETVGAREKTKGLNLID